MRYIDNGSFYTVAVSAAELRDFAARWPCSGMRGASRGMSFQFDKRNGDLVDINGERTGYDGGAVRALSDDAQKFAAPFIECTNCGGPLPATHGTTSRDGKHKFCDACAGFIDALAIGNPKVREVMLYEGKEGGATSWTGARMGTVTHKQAPISHARYLDPHDLRGVRRFAPVRFRVRMLDGTMWHGYGSSANGTYMRLRRMARGG